MNDDELAQAYLLTGGQPIQVDIYCNEASHDGRRYDVYQFGVDELGGPERIWVGVTRRTDGAGSVGHGNLSGARGARAILVGDRYISREEQDEDKALIHREPIRTRYAFECDICGLKVVRHRVPLFAILDKLALSGVSELSLSGLAAIVVK